MVSLRAFLPLLFLACVHQALPPELPQASVESAPAPPAPAPPPQWLVADQSKDVLALGKDGFGVIVDGVRVVVTGTRVRAAKDVADPQLQTAYRMPAWMGGGFLFASSAALYTAETYDGALKPLVSFPQEIDEVRFGPTYVLVHASSGQSWPIDPKTGARVVPSPLGVIDVRALPDGRAAALTELGGVLVTADGKAWTDVTAQLQGPTSDLLLTDEGQLWIVAESGPSARVDGGGRLAFIDHVPEVKPVSLRAKDPRWKSSDSPLRRALQAGFAESEHQALIVESGSVARVDTVTGELLAFGLGKLPPDASCEPVRAPDDVVFACVRKNGTGAFVASHVMGEKSPTIEQSFSDAGVFYASDDGGLLYTAACNGAHAGLCVRAGSGVWQELLDPMQMDGAAPADVWRWVPRVDGDAFGVVPTGANAGVWDAHTGSFRALSGDALAVSGGGSGGKYHRRYGPSTKIVDRSWTTTPSGSLRGWSDNGLTSFEIRSDGSVAASPFHFELAQTAGPTALARSQGRLWQTSDRGATWVEVGTPPLASDKSELDIRACSPLGCDLGGWFRVGWNPTPPEARAEMTIAPGPARIDAVPMPLLACTAAAAPSLSAAARSNQSPEDLGLGNVKVGVASDNGDVAYRRALFPHATLNPPHDEQGGSDRDEPFLRALVHGYETDSGGGGRFTVLGPSKDPMQLRRTLSFVAPFDPSAAARRTSYGTSDLLAAARAGGMTAADVLSEDISVPTVLVPSLESDPSAPADVAFTSDLGMLGVARSNGRVKLAVRPAPQDTQFLVSAAAVGTDDLALLEVDQAGLGHVSRWSNGSVLALFDVPAPTNPLRYPANPDAIAVSAKGDVAVIRTPSGAEPPTASTPALLYQHGAPPQALAPWSTLTIADDPACKSDAGFRAIIHTKRPWLRVPGELADPQDARMMARVKWSSARVCLEAVEIRTQNVQANVLQRGDDPNDRAYSQAITPEAWLIARFGSSGVTAVRAGIGAGYEWRQPQACTLRP